MLLDAKSGANLEVRHRLLFAITPIIITLASGEMLTTCSTQSDGRTLRLRKRHVI